MLNRTTFALLLSIPLCAFGAGGSLFHSSSANETAAEVTTWRGERALKIPVQLSVVDWSRAGFPATSNAETQPAWLYLTETAFQLQDGAGHTLMGGPRSDVGLEVSQCIRMRSLNVSVCANSSFPESKEARETLRGSQTEFSWLYYHLAQAGKFAATAPNGTIMLAGTNTNSSTLAMPVLECQLVNPDGSTAVAIGGPGKTLVAPNVTAGARPEPLIRAPETEPEAALFGQPAAVPAYQPVIDKPSDVDVDADVTVHATAAPAQPAPQIDYAQKIRAMAASSHFDLLEPVGKQPEALLESRSLSVAAVPQPQLPFFVEERYLAPGATTVEPRVATHSTITVTASFATPVPVAALPAAASVPVQPKPVMASAPKAETPVAAAAVAELGEEGTAGFSADDLTPMGAPRGVIPERRVKTVAAAKPSEPRLYPVAAANPVDSHTALLQAEKEARAAHVAEMQLKHAQGLNAIPSTSERKSVPIDKPHSIYANHVTTSTAFSKPAVAPGTPAIRTLAGAPASTAFSKPAYVGAETLTVRPVAGTPFSTAFSKPAVAQGAPAIRTLAGMPAAGEAFAEIAAPAQPPVKRSSPAAIQEIEQATQTQPVQKTRYIERPAFKPAGLPTVVDTDQ